MAEKVDVLFIHPGDQKQIYQALNTEFTAKEPPAFAGLYASYLRVKGLSVAIYDVQALEISAEQAVVDIETLFKPVLVVLAVYGMQPSASTQTMGAAGKICRLLKETAVDYKILMTGTHPAALPERTLREEAIDFVCDREGPVTIHKTLLALKAGTGFEDIPSLWWYDGPFIRSPTSSEGLIKHIDEEMPGIAWDLLDMSRYRAHNWHSFDHIHDRTPYASIHTTMGCPYKCNFCCINAPFGKSSYRMYKPETVVAEIDRLVEQYGVTNIKFIDEMFVLNRRHVEGICDLLLQRDYKVNIWAYARIDSVMDDLLPKMKAAGFNWFALGIESANSTVRNGADKALRDDDIKGVVQRIRDAGIYVLDNYIFGLPEDTLESMEQTFQLSMEINSEFTNYYSAMAYPGSKLYTQAIANNVVLPAKWADYSQHAYGSVPLANEQLTASEIIRFRDQAFTRRFTSEAYLKLLDEKFGKDVVNHIQRLTEIPLKRQLLEDNG